MLHSDVTCEIREKKNLADKFKGLFGGSKSKDDEGEDQVFPPLGETRVLTVDCV